MQFLEGYRTKICIGIGGLAYVLYFGGLVIGIQTISKETLDNILTACGMGAGWFLRSALTNQLGRPPDTPH